MYSLAFIGPDGTNPHSLVGYFLELELNDAQAIGPLLQVRVCVHVCVSFREASLGVRLCLCMRTRACIYVFVPRGIWRPRSSD